MSLVILRPDFEPPDTLAAWEKRHIQPILLLNTHTHIAIIDLDVTVPEEFYHLHEQYPSVDIIAVKVIPSSPIFRVWENLTFWARLGERFRGCAVIYSTRFLRYVGGWPLVETPDTWLLKRSHLRILAPLQATHNQAFNLSHSIKNQLRDGKSRAQLNYPIWKTILHSIFRLRPIVLFAYVRERFR